MSSIFKLQIQGIRSFDTTDKQTIQFSKPLTLIVGQNGTGKTTIIECLKYVTTGDLPPNSKGGAFVHDPVMSSSKEVTGHVKLAFNTSNNKQAICTRTMQLTIKKTARSFKTLDSNLLIKEAAGKAPINLNSRCADMDAEMPRLLGVSKAVLEYVVFCHQEDSLWPLAEPGAVKKRFDEIFEATKFTKALDNIKTIRKEYGNTIKLIEKDVKHYESERTRADKQKEKADGLVANLEIFQEEADALKREMDEVTTRQQQLFESNQEFQKVLYRLDQLRRDRTSYEENAERLKAGVTEMNDADEELQSKLDNFSSKTDERRQRKLQFEDDLGKMNVKIDDERQEYNKLLTQQGQLRGQKEAHEENIQKRAEFAGKIVKDLDLKSGEEPNELKQALDDVEYQVKRELEKSSADANAAESELSNDISQLSSEQSKVEQSKLTARESLSEVESSIKKIQQEMDVLQVDEGMLGFEESKLDEFTRDLARQQEKLESLNADEKIDEQKKKKYELDERLNKLNADFRQATHQAESRSKLEYFKKDLGHKKKALDTLKGSNEEKFKNVVGSSALEPTTVEKDLNEALSDVQSQLAAQSKKVETARGSQSSVKTQLDLKENELKSKNDEIASLQVAVYEVIDDPGTPDILKEQMENAKHDIEVKMEFISKRELYRKWYLRALEHQEAKNECQLCGHHFEEEEVEGFKKEMEHKLNRLNEEEIKAAEQDVQRAREDIKLMEDISPSVQQLNKLRDEDVFAIKSDIKRLTRQCEKEDKNLDQELESLHTLNEKSSDIESLRKFAADVSRYHHEIAELESQIGSIKEEMGDSQSTEPAETIHEELTKTNSEVKTVDQAVQKLVDDRDYVKNGVQQLQSKIANKKLDISTVKQNLYQRQHKEEQVSGLKTQQRKLKNDSQSASAKIKELAPKIEGLKSELNKLKTANEAGLQKIRERQGKVSQAQYHLKTMNEAIDSFVGDAKLEECDLRTGNCAERVRGLEDEMKKLQEQIGDEEKAMIDMKSHERELRDNLEIRRLNREMVSITKEIEELESQNAEQEKKRYDREVKQLQDKYTKLSSEHAGKMGEMRQMDDQLKVINAELHSEFLNVHEKYREEIIRLETTTHANEDLARYSKALDTAVMKYHAMKMERINNTIDELWKKTYTGTDIDTICIKSDNENTRGNRTYNYRVVMVKQDVELDMRGRCSAGQKVLASIIIRLALSETFGQNCGLVALDEPTTNLDAENIESLAKALNSLLQARQNQKNFQLICITHDVEFLRHLSASTYVDHYYRVSRDTTMSSVITQTDINTVDG